MEYFVGSIENKEPNIDLNKLFARFYNIKGTMRADEGKFEDALKYFNKAIDLDPLFSAAFFNRGTIKADTGKFDEAKLDFETAHLLEICPS